MNGRVPEDRFESATGREGREGRRVDPRVPFFVVVALLCFGLVPLSASAYRFVPIVVGGVYTVLAGLFLLASISDG